MLGLTNTTNNNRDGGPSHRAGATRTAPHRTSRTHSKCAHRHIGGCLSVWGHCSLFAVLLFAESQRERESMSRVQDLSELEERISEAERVPFSVLSSKSVYSRYVRVTEVVVMVMFGGD